MRQVVRSDTLCGFQVRDNLPSQVDSEVSDSISQALFIEIIKTVGVHTGQRQAPERST